MSRLTGWWSGRSNAAKVELYTRWSFHSFVLVEITSIGVVPVSTGGWSPPGLALCLLICVHAASSGLLSSRALDWSLDRRERPVRLASGVVALTAAGALTLISLRATGVLKDGYLASTTVLGVVCFTLGAVVLCLRKARHMLFAVPVAAVATGASVAGMGIDPAEAAGIAVGVLVGGGLLGFTCGFSSWLLKAVWELDRSRELQAQLAVAEERLRFGRDLHDVMGRNLAVIALKSELAVQLARRERPEAVEQMIEVQRIAQESQREVRDVVRGYREADLAVELEGARGVLTAAGIDCRVIGHTAGAAKDLPGEVRAALGWVVREATTNVLRHGDPRRCEIRLAVTDGVAVLSVENDGVRQTGAEDTTVTPPGGSGLAGLRERLAALDGTLSAAPSPGSGFRLTATVPVPVPVPVPVAAPVPATGRAPASAPAPVTGADA
ncbi:sensor histidine kinase [Streptomyces sp. NPDC057445]|uniref:sensor histidine kinase n=1 Tax=Streptomyces sp. NPDC057445 TaxID=3346136 RepID=UPI0036A34607